MKHIKSNFLWILLSSLLIDINSNNGNGNGYQKFPSHTYFFDRPLMHYGSQLQYCLNNSSCPDASSLISVTAVGIGSYSELDFAPAFFIGEKNPNLSIAGDNTGQAATRDIRAEWLEGPSEYSGNLTCDPHSSLFGCVISAATPISSILGIESLDNLSLGVLTALSRVEHDIRLNLEPLNTNIFNYLTNPNMPGHFATKRMHEIGFENITLFLKSGYHTSDHILKLDYYGGLEIAGQRAQDFTTIWAPILGNNGHLGMLTGVNLELAMNINNSSMGIFFRGEGHFMIRKEVERTLDLYGVSSNNTSSTKPYSRYMQAINRLDSSIEKTVSEITYLPVTSHPRAFIDISTGCEFNHNGLGVTLGYNLWTHKSEDIYQRDKKQRFRDQYYQLQDYGIKGTNNKTASKSTINNLAENDDTFVALNNYSVDYASGGFSSGHSSSVFFLCELSKEEASGRFGAWLEQGSTGNTPSRYGLWLGFGKYW